MDRTIEQLRASDALKKVKQLRDGTNGYKVDCDKYASYAISLPSTILMNGLGQAAATLLSSSKRIAKDANEAEKKKIEIDAHYVLYKHLEEWLCSGYDQAPYKGFNDLMAAITVKDRDHYMRAQAEALAWLKWLKKFAEAYLKKPGSGE